MGLAEEQGETAGPSSEALSRGQLYFADEVAVCMTAWQVGCREGVLEPLLTEQLYQDMDVATALESIARVCLPDVLSTSLLMDSPESKTAQWSATLQAVKPNDFKGMQNIYVFHCLSPASEWQRVKHIQVLTP